MQLLLDVCKSERQRRARRTRYRFRRVIVYRQIVRRVVIRHTQGQILILKIRVYYCQCPRLRYCIIAVLKIFRLQDDPLLRRISIPVAPEIPRIDRVQLGDIAKFRQIVQCRQYQRFILCPDALDRKRIVFLRQRRIVRQGFVFQRHRDLVRVRLYTRHVLHPRPLSVRHARVAFQHFQRQAFQRRLIIIPRKRLYTRSERFLILAARNIHRVRSRYFQNRRKIIILLLRVRRQPQRKHIHPAA